jgi:hypothetical protein
VASPHGEPVEKFHVRLDKSGFCMVGMAAQDVLAFDGFALPMFAVLWVGTFPCRWSLALSLSHVDPVLVYAT